MKGLSFRRAEANMTQYALAEKIGVDRSAIAKWESGYAYPSADKLPIIAAALNCSIDDLFAPAPCAAS